MAEHSSKDLEATVSLQPEMTPAAEAAAGLGNALGTSDVTQPLEAPARAATNGFDKTKEQAIDAVASPQGQGEGPSGRRTSSGSFFKRLSSGSFGLPRPSFGFRRSSKVGSEGFAADEAVEITEATAKPTKPLGRSKSNKTDDVDIVPVKAQRVRSIRIGSH